MDDRSTLGHKNTLSAQRAMSASYALPHQPARRPPPPSRLSNVRSASQPVPPPHMGPAPATNDTRHRKGSSDVIELDKDDNDDERSREGEEDEIDGRPAKRARLDGDTLRHRFAASDSPHSTETSVDAAHETLPGSPLPQLPKQRTVAGRHAAQNNSRSRRDLATRKAHGLEPPAIATKLPPPRHVADFSPWSGQHPEDVLSETVIKSGYFEKPSGPNSTECNSAKPMIWPSLGSKASYNVGLQTLSYLFTQVMEKRQAMGKCTAPSTFKPPPRVTVTDTKREAWLRDLANSEIPLRKQSRTIPHGIRGKLLMEQCLGKGISMPRAVWLAKCVGANELRAFRRKGVSGAAAASGECKWIREWTTHVEQFLEGVIASCGQPEWQMRMDYALKLATSFYSECLLERDHYLDWIVSSFATSTVERLPIWIILLQLYWKDVTAFTKRGRRFAEAALEFLHHLMQKGNQGYVTLKMRLQKLIIVLAITKRGCLVLPRTWERYRHLLAPGSLRTDSSSALESPAQNVTRRNKRLTDPLRKTPQNTRSPLLQLYSMLDAVATDVDVDKIVATALSLVPEPANLVPALLDWAASFYRAGISRIHLAAQQILRLRDDRQNTDDAILEYLRSRDSNAVDVTKVHLVVGELVRIDGFSTSRYFQWLITSGALTQGSELATGLLSVLPMNTLPPHLHNTRQTLIRRLAYALDEEPKILQIESEVMVALSQSGPAFSKSMAHLDALSCSAKCRISRRVNAKAKLWAKDRALSLQIFCQLRELAERSKDVLALSDLVEAGLLTDDTVFLATVVDTLHLYAKCFAAVGRLPLLSSLCVERYRALRSQQSLDRTLIVSLKLFLALLQNEADLLRLLENDLAICDQQSSMAVCSPASDNLVSMQASCLDSDDDIDAVFASGNTMDEQLMQRVFARIMQRAGKPGVPSTHAPSKLCAWWTQLRAVDASGFEQLVRKYLRSCLADVNNAKGFTDVVSTLVASTCVGLDAVLLLARESHSSQAALVALTMALSGSVANQALHDSERFRYRVQQRRYCLNHADVIASLLILAMDDPAFSQNLAAVSDLLRRYTANGKEHVLSALIDVEKPSPSYTRNCSQLFADLLHMRISNGAMQQKIRAGTIVAMADPLSVEHCAAALQFYSKTGHFNGPDDSAELQQALLDAIAGGCQVWPQLLVGAGQRIMSAIYKWSRDRVLASNMNPPVGACAAHDEDTQRQLEVLDITHGAAKGDDLSQILTTLTERLKTLEIQLSNTTSENGSVPLTTRLLSSLGVTLHLTILYSLPSSTVAADGSDALKQSQAHLLAALCALLLHPHLQRHPHTLEYMYDIAASLSSALPDASLAALSKSLAPHTARDPRIASILGDHATSPDAWLALVSPNNNNPSSSSSSSSTAGLSQQQRLLMKHTPGAAQQQQQQQTTGSLSPLPARQPLPPAAAAAAAAHLGAGQAAMGPHHHHLHHPLPPHPSAPPHAPAAAAAATWAQKSAAHPAPRGFPAPTLPDPGAKTLPFPLRRWEIMSDATPTVGENDTSLSLGLFGARRV